MAIKYNPYNWEIRPREEFVPPKRNKETIEFDVNINEEEVINAIMEALDITLKDSE